MHTATFAKLKPGERVRMQDHISGNWDRTAIVIRERPDGSSYVIRTAEGKEYVRGRRLLKPEKVGNSSSISQKPAERQHTSLPTRIQPQRLVKKMPKRRSAEESHQAQPSDNFQVLERVYRASTIPEDVQTSPGTHTTSGSSTTAQQPTAIQQDFTS